MKQMKNQKGFTLVEIAIVLVIIGLLLGGVLKGQELIENGKVKNAATTIQAIIAAYNGYTDRYRRLAGDDGPLATLQARSASWATITVAGGNDGVVNVGDSPWNNATAERVAFFQHLRAGGFITGNPASIGGELLPRNPWGGLVSVSNAANQGRATTRILQVCLSNVPGKAAVALDTQFDDGRPNLGGLRATQGGNNVDPAGAAPAAYSEDQLYSICSDIM
jgi:prepilin-type N-terminal cleavage/methylation domain-containing protein